MSFSFSNLLNNYFSFQAFLHMCRLDFSIEQKANAEHMSPSGDIIFPYPLRKYSNSMKTVSMELKLRAMISF